MPWSSKGLSGCNLAKNVTGYLIYLNLLSPNKYNKQKSILALKFSRQIRMLGVFLFTYYVFVNTANLWRSGYCTNPGHCALTLTMRVLFHTQITRLIFFNDLSLLKYMTCSKTFQHYIGAKTECKPLPLPKLAKTCPIKMGSHAANFWLRKEPENLKSLHK